MKRISKALTVAVMVSFALILTACIPKGYSSEAKKNIKSEHEVEAKEWFEKNQSGSKFLSGDALAGTNLYMAIEGRYSKAGREYRYLYDYKNDIMYLEEYADEASEIVKRKIAEEFDLDEDKTEISINRHEITLTSANDAGNEQYGHIPYGAEETVNYPYYEFGTLPEDIASNALYGEVAETEFSVKAYAETIPDYDYKRIQSFSGLGYISYIRPMDLEFAGVNYAVHYREWATIYYVNLTKAEDNLYVGYTCEERLSVDEDGNVTGGGMIEALNNQPAQYEKIASDEFEVSIPKGTDILFIAPKDKYYDCFVNGSGENSETKFDDGDSLDSKEFAGYTVLSAKYIVPKTKLRAYDLAWKRRAATYDIKIK